MAFLAIPLIEIAVEAIAAAVEVAAANAGRAVVVTGVAYGAAKLSNSSSSSTTAADTTTVKGKGKMNCGEDGNYGDLQKKTGDNKYDRDHIPSKAALQKAAQNILDDNPGLAAKLSDTAKAALFGENGMISKSGLAIAIPKADHKNFSPTYGSKNSETQIENDAEDLQGAAKRDAKAMEDAEGKEMDPECFEKYKKAADKITKRTNAEYDKALTDVIKQAIEKFKVPK
jgi:hypothetical protein